MTNAPAVLRRACVLALGLLMAYYGYVAISLGLAHDDLYRNLGSRAVRQMVLATLPSDTTLLVYSSNPWAIWYQTGRLTRELPRAKGLWPSDSTHDIRKTGGLALWFPFGGQDWISPESLKPYVLRDTAGMPVMWMVSGVKVMAIRAGQ